MPKSVFTDAYRILLEHLIAARKQAGVSQVELGKRLGRQQSVISLIESGERRLDVIEFYAIARALGYDPAALFSGLVEKLPLKVGI